MIVMFILAGIAHLTLRLFPTERRIPKAVQEEIERNRWTP